MTLVLSVLTPEAVVQVSDRRFFFLDGRAVRLREDEETQAVLWCDRVAFAYTGLGQMGDERRTDAWLANRIEEIEARAGPGVDVSKLFSTIAELASEFFRRPRIRRVDPRLRRHAFVAVGWARFDEEPEPSSYLALISNYHREGSELAMAQPRFDAYVRRLPPGQGGHVLPIGHPLAQRKIDELGARLAGTGNEPGAMVEVLGAELREAAVTAGGPADTVDPVITVLPRGGPPDAPNAITVCGGTISPDFAVTPT